eukprot:1512144-Amphidinium_carterae.1
MRLLEYFFLNVPDATCFLVPSFVSALEASLASKMHQCLDSQFTYEANSASKQTVNQMKKKERKQDVLNNIGTSVIA